jgi:hypothetical protein
MKPNTLSNHAQPRRREARCLLLVWAVLGMSQLLSSCAATYTKAPEGGKFTGEPRMVPIAPNTFFFYQPKGKDVLFSYTTAPANAEESLRRRGRGSYRWKNFKIIPEPMLTTGASVPRQLWLVPGFSNFDFTRAAIIHDWLFEAHHRWVVASEANNEVQMKRYAAYKDMTQEDAADIFAECIKATMKMSDSLIADLQTLGHDAAPGVKMRLDELRAESRNTNSKNWKIWAYHYFVSPDCVAQKSVKMWNTNHDDLGLYELFADKFAQTAVDRGYLSDWLIGRFKDVYRFKQEQVTELEKVKLADDRAEVAGRLRARIYLEVPDQAAENAIRSRKNDYASQKFDLKRAAFRPDISPQELTVVYYHDEDKDDAEKLLRLIVGQLPPGGVTPVASTKQIEGQDWARSKHFDVRVGAALAAALAK